MHWSKAPFLLSFQDLLCVFFLAWFICNGTLSVSNCCTEVIKTILPIQLCPWSSCCNRKSQVTFLFPWISSLKGWVCFVWSIIAREKFFWDIKTRVRFLWVLNPRLILLLLSPCGTFSVDLRFSQQDMFDFTPRLYIKEHSQSLD